MANDEMASTFHIRTRLGKWRDGLLVDIGAVGNLVGSAWVKRQTDRAAAHNLPTKTVRMTTPLGVEGVGKGAQVCVESISVPTSLPDGSLGTYSAPIVENSDLPALWGLDSLSHQRALIDTFSKRVYLVGAGGYGLKLSPGSRILQCETSESGHMLLPVSDFEGCELLKHGTNSKAEAELANPKNAFLTRDA